MSTFRRLKTRLSESAPPQVLEAIQKIVDKNVRYMSLMSVSSQSELYLFISVVEILSHPCAGTCGFCQSVRRNSMNIEQKAYWSIDLLYWRIDLLAKTWY